MVDSNFHQTRGVLNSLCIKRVESSEVELSSICERKIQVRLNSARLVGWSASSIISIFLENLLGLGYDPLSSFFFFFYREPNWDPRLVESPAPDNELEPETEQSRVGSGALKAGVARLS